MIENKNESNRNLEKALQALEQAKQRAANEKKKQNEKKRKTEVNSYNKKNLERELQNESQQHNSQQSKAKGGRNLMKSDRNMIVVLYSGISQNLSS